MTETAYAQRILALCWLDPTDAALCLRCEAVFRKSEPECPACGSALSVAMLAFLAP